MGFVWGVCDCEIGIVRKAQQGGEEGVGCQVFVFDREGKRECHQEIADGSLRSALGDSAARVPSRRVPPRYEDVM